MSWFSPCWVFLCCLLWRNVTQVHRIWSKNNMVKEPLIVFDHFSFRYASQQVETLKNIDLTIHKGEKV